MMNCVLKMMNSAFKKMDVVFACSDALWSDHTRAFLDPGSAGGCGALSIERFSIERFSHEVSFQWKNQDFPLKNPHFLLKDVEFIIKTATRGSLLQNRTEPDRPAAYCSFNGHFFIDFSLKIQRRWRIASKDDDFLLEKKNGHLLCNWQWWDLRSRTRSR